MPVECTQILEEVDVLKMSGSQHQSTSMFSYGCIWFDLSRVQDCLLQVVFMSRHDMGCLRYSNTPTLEDKCVSDPGQRLQCESSFHKMEQLKVQGLAQWVKHWHPGKPGIFWSICLYQRHELWYHCSILFSTYIMLTCSTDVSLPHSQPAGCAWR